MKSVTWGVWNLYKYILANKGVEVDFFFLDIWPSTPYTISMKNKKIKSVAYGDPCVGKASAQFKKVYLDMTCAIMPEAIKTSFDSLVGA